MEYGKIIAVTGMPGLFELLSSKTDGAIVRSLDDKTSKFVSSRVHNFSHLESIEVFTTRDNVNLAEIFMSMEKNDEKAPDGKDTAALKKYFEQVYPDLDFERVYTSDLKKMVKWYSVLKENEVEIKLSTPRDEEVNIDTPVEEPIEDKPAPVEEPGTEEEKPKKVAKKKAVTKDSSEDDGEEDKPVKKVAAKKKKSEE